VIRKVLSFIVTLVLISVITFISVNVLPGDPALLIVGTEGDPARLEIVRQQLGLDRPLAVRYLQWLSGVIHGDFGQSIRYSQDIAALIKGALPATLSLAFMGVGLAVICSIPLGVFCAVKQRGILAKVMLLISQAGMAVPAFWLGLVLINVFALKLGWLPPTGFDSPLSLILPVMALALPRAAILTRVVRECMLEAMHQDYLRTARSKGLSERVVMYKHALKNAAVSIMSVAGVHLTQLLGGTIVIEQVFSLPGLGQLLLAAVLQRDLPLVQGLVVVTAALVLFVNLLLDLALALVDPRVRYE